MAARSPDVPGRKYVWERLKDTAGIDYMMILRERRMWLLQQELSRNENLLCEWFALVQELDTCVRESLGVDEFGTKLTTAEEEDKRRQRSRSFAKAPRQAESDEVRKPRSNSFMDFLFEAENGGANKSASGTAGEAVPNVTTPTTAESPAQAAASISTQTRGSLPNSGASSPDYSTFENPEAIQFLRGKPVEPNPELPSPTATKGGVAVDKEGIAADTSSTTVLSPASVDSTGGLEQTTTRNDPIFSPTSSEGPFSPDSLSSPISPSVGDGGRLIIRKKRKVPNKALKKLFKVVPKKESENGPQSPGAVPEQKEWL